MGNSEQRRHAKDLGQVCPEACEHEVGQQNLLLHLARDVIDGTGIRQVEHRPALGERGVKIVHDRHRGIVCEHGQR